MVPLADTYTAFRGTLSLGSGPLVPVALAAHRALAKDPTAVVTVISHDTGRAVDLDLRGTEADVAARHAPPDAPRAAAAHADTARPRGRGRPRMGVVAREVTLLPEHWDWLAGQPGGASVALRKLVEAASRANETKDRLRRAQEAAYRFMAAMAGNQPGYEEAVRALFADMPEQFGVHTQAWPADVRDHARMLALRVFGVPGAVLP